jgi:hypothetical protein
MRRLAISPVLVIALFSVASAETTAPAPAPCAPAPAAPAQSDATSEAARQHPNWFTEWEYPTNPAPAAWYFRMGDTHALAFRNWGLRASPPRHLLPLQVLHRFFTAAHLPS